MLVVMVGVPVQLSVAVGNAVVKTSEHSMVTSAGTLAKTGTTVSLTVTFCVAKPILLQPSVADQVRTKDFLFTQTESIKVEVKPYLIAPIQLSVAVKFAGVGTAPLQVTVILAGALANTGAVWSKIVIFCVAEVLFPHSSIATQTRVIVFPFAQVESEVTSVAIIVT